MLSIAAVGAVTNVGIDATSTMLSIRAGIQRQDEIRGFTTYDPDDMETPLFGCPVTGITDGFQFAGVWIRLAELAFRDVIRQVTAGVADVEGYLQRTAIFWALPNVVGPRIMWPQDVLQQRLGMCLNHVLLEHTPHPPRIANHWVTVADHAAAFEALARVGGLLQADNLDRVLLVAVDSFLDQKSLQHAIEWDAIRMPNGRDGYLPGEAAAALLFSKSTQNAMAAVRAAAVNADPLSCGDEQNERNTAMARKWEKAIVSVLDEVFGEEFVFAGDLYLDANGERWRDQVFGELVTLTGGRIDWDQTSVVVPGESVGEIGAAFGGLNLAMAAWCFAQNASQAELALVLSLDDDGTVAVALVSRA